MSLSTLIRSLQKIPQVETYGYVTSIEGLLLKVSYGEGGIGIGMGMRCRIDVSPSISILGSVVGFESGYILVMPYGSLDGMGPGCKVIFHHEEIQINPTMQWRGRVINALGEPLDGLGALPQGDTPIPVHRQPPAAHARQKVGTRMSLGIRTIDTFLTMCQGQRMGIFAGSGVGKSVLLSMLARFAENDVCVIGMIGERGREVREFIEETLGEAGLKRSVIVVATSDQPPLMRRQAAYMTLAVAEYFRDQGLSVLCLMDSVTRFAMAQREIGLSAGEPSTSKGYTPSVFTELSKVLERAGPGIGKGMITGFFTVLVDGDDHNEPIADAVRGILDGHIVLDRAIAERGHFPAINILRSISRTVPGCHLPHEIPIVRRARQALATYADMEDMIRLGAYRQGSNEEVDWAISVNPRLMTFLAQLKEEHTPLEAAFAQLKAIVESEG